MLVDVTTSVFRIRGFLVVRKSQMLKDEAATVGSVAGGMVVTAYDVLGYRNLSRGNLKSAGGFGG